MNPLLMLLLGILLAIKAPPTSASIAAVGVPINESYYIMANINYKDFIVRLYPPQGLVENEIIIVPISSIKTVTYTSQVLGNVSLIALSGNGLFPGILQFVNGTTYIGYYYGSFTPNYFEGYFIPALIYNNEQTTQSVYTTYLGSNLNATIIVKSPIPVLLRYGVFNYYDELNGSLINTVNPIPIMTNYPPITIDMAVGINCHDYQVIENFSKPLSLIPEPFTININYPVMYVVSQITLLSTIPESQVSILEPGDLLMSKEPVVSATFLITICSLSTVNYTGPENLYARDYTGEIGFNVPWQLINAICPSLGPGEDSIELINEIMKCFNTGNFSLSSTTYSPSYALSHGVGSLLDYDLLSAYILRQFNVPSRIALGFLGSFMGNDEYIFNSNDSIVWVEAFTNNGWLSFEPIKPNHSGNFSIPLNVLAYSTSLGLLLMIPWLIGYYIYYYLSRSSTRYKPHRRNRVK